MVIRYEGVSGVLPDNDLSYFSLLRGAIDSVDPGSSMSIIKGTTGYIFRLVPSTTVYIDTLIHQLTEMNTLMGIQLEFSKSCKSSSVIHWKVEI